MPGAESMSEKGMGRLYPGLGCLQHTEALRCRAVCGTLQKRSLVRASVHTASGTRDDRELSYFVLQPIHWEYFCGERDCGQTAEGL